MEGGNLFADLPDASAEEQVALLMNSHSTRVERIVSKGQSSPEGFWYDQMEDEFVLLLQGQAKLLIEGEKEPRLLSEGDHLLIPAHCRHRVDWTQPDRETIWLAIFSDHKQ